MYPNNNQRGPLTGLTVMHPNFMKPAPNPYLWRQREKMERRNARWVWKSKSPKYIYDHWGNPQFNGYTPGQTYRRTV